MRLPNNIEHTKGKVIFRFNATDPYLCANGERLRNLLYNLIDNAIKYTVERPEIILTTYTTNDTVYHRN